MHTISFDRLTKSYGPVLAVDGLSFDVGPGGVTGFPGPNGAGKSTTMRMIAKSRSSPCRTSPNRYWGSSPTTPSPGDEGRPGCQQGAMTR